MAIIDYGYDQLALYLIKKDFADGINTFRHYYNGTAVDIDAEVYSFSGNTTYSSNPVLGDAVADTKMLMLRYGGNLTINSGVTFTPQVRKKGMMIFVDGDCTIDGRISMSARGAIAVGQNINIIKNGETNQMYSIPAVGGLASTTRSINTNGSWSAGYTGGVGTNGATGGGGGGGARTGGTSRTAQGGLGSNGTSYSGGSGGGAGCNGYGGSTTGGNAAANGGAGGAGIGSDCISWVIVGGGAGNPGGARYNCNASTAGSTGTGGLLILIVAGTLTISSTGRIDSNGSNGGNDGGGGSGGGSVNIFAQAITNNGSVTANGASGGYMGGAGGNGTVRSLAFDIKGVQALFKYNNKYYRYDTSTGSIVDSTIPANRLPTALEFSDKGTQLSIVPISGFDSLPQNFELVLFSKSAPNNVLGLPLQINMIPLPKLVIQKDDYDVNGIINNFTLTSLTPGTSVAKIVFSVDNGVTWKYYRNEILGTVNINDFSDILLKGMTASEFSALSKSFWNQNAPLNKIKIAYYLEQNESNNIPKFNSLTVNKGKSISTPKINSMNINYDEIEKEYYGLLFSDSNLDYYSTSTGVKLKGLIFDKLVSGEYSSEIKVVLNNSYNFKVGGIVINQESNLSDVFIEFSKTTNPFIAESSLVFDQTLNPEENIEFFVRATANKSAEKGGSFKIKVNGSRV